jgi:hypothetical protein
MRPLGWRDYKLRRGRNKAKSERSIHRSSINQWKIRYGNSAPRNLFILKYLDNLRYVDGFPMILRKMDQRTRFEETGELFVLKRGHS